MDDFNNEPAQGAEFNRPMQFTDLPMWQQEAVAKQMAGSEDGARIAMTLSMIQTNPAIGAQAMKMVPSAGAGRPTDYAGVPTRGQYAPPAPPQIPQAIPQGARQPHVPDPNPPYGGEFPGGALQVPQQVPQQQPQSPQSQYNAPQRPSFSPESQLEDYFNSQPQAPQAPADPNSYGAGEQRFEDAKAKRIADKSDDGMGIGTLAVGAGALYGGKKIYDAKKATKKAQADLNTQNAMDAEDKKTAKVEAAQKRKKAAAKKKSVKKAATPKKAATAQKLKPGESKVTVLDKTPGKVVSKTDTEQEILKNISDEAKQKPKAKVAKAKKQPAKGKPWSDTKKSVTLMKDVGDGKTYYHQKDSAGKERYFVKTKKGTLQHVGDTVAQVKAHASKGSKDIKFKDISTKEKVAPVTKFKDEKSKAAPEPRMKKSQTKKSRNGESLADQQKAMQVAMAKAKAKKKKAVKKKATNVQSTDNAEKVKKAVKATKKAETALTPTRMTQAERSKLKSFEYNGNKYYAKTVKGRGVVVYTGGGKEAGASMQKRVLKAAEASVKAAKTVTTTKKQRVGMKKTQPKPTADEMKAMQEGSVQGGNKKQAAINKKRRAKAKATKATANAIRKLAK